MWSTHYFERGRPLLRIRPASSGRVTMGILNRIPIKGERHACRDKTADSAGSFKVRTAASPVGIRPCGRSATFAELDENNIWHARLDVSSHDENDAPSEPLASKTSTP
jgi:hypothetical protein